MISTNIINTRIAGKSGREIVRFLTVPMTFSYAIPADDGSRFPLRSPAISDAVHRREQRPVFGERIRKRCPRFTA